ncbi:putative acetyltransferase [Halolamina pelagica]|uniref:Putative acetyltransferase n=1 Tax=Halolamina pelagica TaxID=699431 RepID=A0A0P7FY52_9EURY|nr:GNAT family N-acetyltransferase [Halolamina pelagica]KPN32172.1 putative acetyltransferase [Halolamina pelagica]
MEIEAPTMDDADRLAELWVDLARSQRAHGSHLLAEPNRETVREGLARAIVTQNVLVARTDDDLAGFVEFAPETDSYRQDVARGVIENIYVRPSHRDTGLGADLLAAAEARLLDAGIDRVTLEVLADNEAARRFYARQGYEPHRVELEKAPESDTHSKED